MRLTFAIPCLAAALFVSCGEESEAPPTTATQVEVVPPRELQDMLGSTLTRLGVTARSGELSAPELRANRGLLPGEQTAALESSGEPKANAKVAAEGDADQGLDPELIELREGLIGAVESNPSQLASAKKDIAHLKDEIAEVMVAGFTVEGRSPTALRILIDLAAQCRTPEVGLAIARVAAGSSEGWIKRYAAWSLASFADVPGAEQAVPLMLRRLKYEREPETAVWIASALGAFGNYAGVDLLYQTTSLPAGDPAGDAARAQLAAVLDGAAPAMEVEERPTTAQLLKAWNAGELGRPHGSVSQTTLGEVWILLADLSGEHFQLRGVDDARHILSALGPWAAQEFAMALVDDDEYVRLHTAQVLERMGSRGLSAFDSLKLSLHDPHGAVAGAAADALVAVTRGTVLALGARTALLARMEVQCSYETKVACIRALGHLAPEVIPSPELLALFEAATLSDLRLAAADGLLQTEEAARVLPWFLQELQAEVGDPAGAEAVLGKWLLALPSDAARAAQNAWNNEAAPMNVVHTRAQAKARRRARAAALAALGDWRE